MVIKTKNKSSSDLQKKFIGDAKSPELIRLGQINFINCLPINYALAKNLDSPFKFSIFEGSPAQLNKMLSDKEIDIAPISSFEYLKNKNNYKLLGNLSISSKKKADSVLFFSAKPLSELKTIYLTSKSATSVNLLKIILKEKYNLKNLEFLVFDDLLDNSLMLDKSISNKLLIGDEALLENKNKYHLVLDLGEEWFQMTGLPMVFGLWAYQKSFDVNQELIEFFGRLKNDGLNKYFSDVVINAFMATGIVKTRLTEYFSNLDYDFNEKHQESLSLFEKYLAKYGLLDLHKETV